MTLPTDIILPLRPEQIKSGDPYELELYIRDLIYDLTTMYQGIAQNVNGTLKQFTPVMFGFTTRGTGTYTRQTGWVLRQGILVEIWIDVQWTAHTGTGFLILELPYKSAKTENVPWTNQVSSTMTLDPGYTNVFISANSDSINGVVFQSGSGLNFLGMTVPAAGRISGYVRYVGQEFE